jgi:hypothetical protein
MPTSESPKSNSNAAISYFDSTIDLLNRLKATQLPNIHKASELFADRIAKGGLIFLFGCGHSRMMCEEMTPRQGCFVGFFALIEQSISNHASIIGTNGLRPPLYLEKYEGRMTRSSSFRPAGSVRYRWKWRGARSSAVFRWFPSSRGNIASNRKRHILRGKN